MTEPQITAPGQPKAWQTSHALVMVVICLLVGVAVGYLIRGSVGRGAPAMAARGASMAASVPSIGGAGQAQSMGEARQQITPEELKQMADTQAAPLLHRLKSEPNNAQLLADLGRLNLDAQQFPVAIDYYQRSLKIQPGNTNARTEFASALWLVGDADGAIKQFKTVLQAEPTKPNALMNLGVVEWRGKMDVPAAVAAWEKLLATNPNFPGRENVERLIAQAKKHSNLKLGAKTSKSPM